MRTIRIGTDAPAIMYAARAKEDRYSTQG